MKQREIVISTISTITTSRHLISRHFERLSLIIGLSGILVTAAVMSDRYFGARLAVSQFKQVMAAEVLKDQNPVAAADKEATNGFVHLLSGPSTSIALLTITSLDLEVPIFPESDAVSLNRGAGLVSGSPLPGEQGNISVAAHRDSFFRPLKDIELGDIIALRSSTAMQEYRVVEIFITDPLDISVLESTDESVLTLITCYPFNYVGFAPDRFIVRAEALPVSAPASST